jgi:hypothetical protein
MGWAVEPDGTPYTAPEGVRLRLIGRVRGHAGHADGTFVRTTALRGRRDGDHVVTDGGTTYRLGLPDETYEGRFPGARDRLLAVLPELPAESGGAA